MSAFVIFQLSPRDPVKIAEYSTRAMPFLTAHGGKALGLGPLSSLFGKAVFDRGAVFEFPDRASATAWYESTDYQALLDLRAEAMDCSVLIIG